MRVVIIGGTGHVGTFLVPRLVNAGHELICVSRGQRKAYQAHTAWTLVKQVEIDRVKAEDKNQFGDQIRDLAPDAVIDMICFTPKSAMHLVKALRGHVQHFIGFTDRVSKSRPTRLSRVNHLVTMASTRQRLRPICLRRYVKQASLLRCCIPAILWDPVGFP